MADAEAMIEQVPGGAEVQHVHRAARQERDLRPGQQLPVSSAEVGEHAGGAAVANGIQADAELAGDFARHGLPALAVAVVVERHGDRADRQLMAVEPRSLAIGAHHEAPLHHAAGEAERAVIGP